MGGKLGSGTSLGLGYGRIYDGAWWLHRMAAGAWIHAAIMSNEDGIPDGKDGGMALGVGIPEMVLRIWLHFRPRSIAHFGI